MTETTGYAELLPADQAIPIDPHGSFPRQFIGIFGALQAIIFHNNKVAGWWKDLSTGEDLTTQTRVHEGEVEHLGKRAIVRTKRNVPEMIALMHSELSEGLEGYRKNLYDDKLPHRPMIEVEFADTIIRIMDCAGGLNLDVGGAIMEKLAYNAQREDHKIETRQAPGGKTI